MFGVKYLILSRMHACVRSDGESGVCKLPEVASSSLQPWVDLSPHCRAPFVGLDYPLRSIFHSQSLTSTWSLAGTLPSLALYMTVACPPGQLQRGAAHPLKQSPCARGHCPHRGALTAGSPTPAPGSSSPLCPWPHTSLRPS